MKRAKRQAVGGRGVTVSAPGAASPPFDATDPEATATTGTPSPGVAVTAARRDHVHDVAYDDATPPAATVTDGTPLSGTATDPARRDHAHDVAYDDTTPPAATVTDGTPLSGTATDPARRDHAHSVGYDDTTPPEPLGSASSGTAADPARRDHIHPAPTVDATAVLVQFVVLASADKGNDQVHALFAANDASNAFPGPFTSPDVPRCLQVVFEAAWDGDDVNVVGTDQYDAATNEIFVSSPGTTVVGNAVFKTVTSATKGVQGASADGASIGLSAKMGVVATSSTLAGLADTYGVAWRATTSFVTNGAIVDVVNHSVDCDGLSPWTGADLQLHVSAYHDHALTP